MHMASAEAVPPARQCQETPLLCARVGTLPRYFDHGGRDDVVSREASRTTTTLAMYDDQKTYFRGLIGFIRDVDQAHRSTAR